MRRGQPRRWAVGPYTDKELSCVALRVQGIKPEEIAVRLALTPTAVYNLLSRVYKKAGIAGASELPQWATEHGMDALGPEKPEEMEVRESKRRRTKTRIRLRRI